MDSEQRCVALTPPQVIAIHGWWNPVKILTWRHIIDKPTLTVRYLLRTAKMTVEQAHFLQPQASEWAHAGRADFCDVPLMARWPLCPIRHLGGGLPSPPPRARPVPPPAHALTTPPPQATSPASSRTATTATPS